MKKEIKISVCIPVYGTEQFLSRCLESVGRQEIPQNEKEFIEVVLVDDCSPAGNRKESGDSKKILKEFHRQYGVPVTFVRHEENKGLVEARRSAVYAAKGKYIFNLDSDDYLPDNALKVLYEKAVESKADIVHGKGQVCLNESENVIQKDSKALDEYKKNRELLVSRIYEGELINQNGSNQILDEFLIKKTCADFLWGKLILRETYLNAFEHIPPIFCTMSEDIIQYVWLCYEAKKYAGINEVVYNYTIDTGISSNIVIDNLNRWEKVCSSAGVFTALYEQFDNPQISFTDEEKNSIRLLCGNFLKNNLNQLEKAVVPELKEQAYEMLCDYWGKGFVEKLSGK